ncbi:hypothetical protein IJJ39_00245 [Candidatus Saccharibacteria bacterium]|nr:hypothetical protein [Candidatus Saccharibacteria bacterium]
MYKSIIYSTIAATMLTASAGLIIATNTSANSEAPIVLADNASTLSAKPAIDSKNEIVYGVTDSAGKYGSVFVGNQLYTGSNSLPVSLSISYYLDDSLVSASELVGKSGHVKIVYHYTSESEFSGTKIPFLAITGLTLDSAKFSNISLDNGKIISERDSITVVGYAMPGMNEDFGTDMLPDSFSIEADVNNFSLSDSYTLVTNDFFKEIDTAKLSDVDNLRSSINELSRGLDQIIAGSSSLTDGLSSALTGAKELFAGSKTLVSGIASAAAGATTLSDGLEYITSNNEALEAGATTIITSTLEDLAGNGINVTIENYNDVLAALITSYTENLTALSAHPEAAPAGAIETLTATITSLSKAKALLDFSTGVIGYTNGVASAAAGASDLKDGLALLNSKAPELVTGLGALVDGTSKLYEGSVQLGDGLATFKTTGIDKLVSFANNDIASFTRNARAAASAAKSYNNFSSTSAESVKFIIKTPSIK